MFRISSHKYGSLQILASTVIISLIFFGELFAATPPTPTGFLTGGLFAQYFKNAVDNPCPVDYYMRGLKNAPGSDYMKPDCVVGHIIDKWDVSGNAGTTAANFIGTTDAQPLMFKTNGVQNMILDTAGNVGIGTATPGAKLQVYGGPIMTAGYSRVLSLSANHPTIQFKGISDTNHSAFIGYDAQSTSEALNFWVGGATDDVGVAQRAMSIRNNGFVGIGTAIPVAPLEVKSNQDNTLRLTQPDAGDGWNYIEYASNAGRRWWVGTDTAGNFNIARDGSAGTIAHIVNVGLAVDGTISSVGSMSAPTYYDSDDLTYYINPNGGSILNTVKIVGGGPGAGKVLTSDASGLASWQTAPASLPAGVAGNTPYNNGTSWVTSSNIYNNNGNVGIGTSTPSEKLEVNGNLKFTGANPYISASSYFIAPGGAYFNAGTVYTEAAIQARGGIHNDTNAVLSLLGGTSGDTYISGKLGIGTSTPSQTLSVEGSAVLRSTSPTLVLRDTNERSAMIHTNSNYLYFLRGCGNDREDWCPTGGYWPLYLNLENNNAQFGGSIDAPGTISSVGSMSAPTYYDRDDPSYYINPNGGSQVNTIYANGWFRAQGDTGLYFQDHGGGFYMVDNTWIRTYNNASFYQNAGILRTDGTLQVGGGGSTFNAPNGGGVSIGTSLSVVGGVTAGAIKIVDGTQGAGKLLTSDASGLASWQTAPASFPAGVAGNTIYNNGTSWVASSNIYNNNGNVGIGTSTPGAKLDVQGGAIGGSYALTPKYASWGSYGVGDGGAAIYNDNGGYHTLMLVGNDSAGGVRQVSVWDQLNVNGGASISSNLIVGGTISSVGSMSAPTYYDRDNPAYYINPNGESQVSAIYADSWFRAKGDTGLFFQDHGGGFYMVDNTWIRTYNNASFYQNAGILRTDGTLQVGGGGSTFNAPNGSDVTIGTNLSVVGSVTAASFSYSSDRSLKKDIIPLEDSLHKLLSLNGYSFTWKKDGKKDIGVIAQEVEKVFPNLVHTDPKTGLKSVEYGNLIAPIIEAIKSQQKTIADQNIRIKSLEERLDRLESQSK